MGSSRKIWLAVTNDELELPLYVGDSAHDLANFLEITTNTLYKYKIHEKNNKGKGYRNFKIVAINND